MSETTVLDAARVPWDTMPMFHQEGSPLGAAPFVYLPGDGARATFVYAYLPATAYNVVRDAALDGDVLFRSIIVQHPPSDVPTNADGSLDLQWMATAGLRWPSGSVHQVTAGGASAQPEAIGEILRGVAQIFVTVAQIAADAIQSLIEFFGGAISGTGTATIALTFANPDPDFAPAGDPLRRTWGTGADVGAVLRTHGALLVARRTDGLPSASHATLSATDAASFTLTRGGSYAFCVRLQSGLTTITADVAPTEMCSASLTIPRGGISATLTFADGRVQALLAALDEIEFFGRMQIPIRGPTILVGQVADFVTGFNGGLAFTLGLGGFEPGTVLAGNLLEAELLGGAFAPLIALLDVDIILPTVGVNSRLIISHELGHHAFYQMMLHAAPPDVYAQHMLEIYDFDITPGLTATDPIFINEGIADVIGNQLSGGGVVLLNAATGSTYVGDGGGGAEFYCHDLVPGCFDTNLTGTEAGATREVQASRIATILYDFLDDATPGPGSPGHNDASWVAGTVACPALTPCPTSNMPAAPPGPTLGDEKIALSVAVLQGGIAAWLQDPLSGRLFVVDEFMRGMTRAIRLAGRPDNDICDLYKLHTPFSNCPDEWMAP